MRPQAGTFAGHHQTNPNLHREEFPALSEAVRRVVSPPTNATAPPMDHLPWIHAWEAGGSAIFDVVEIEAIRRTLHQLVPGFP